MKTLTSEHFHQVLKDAAAQVFEGKGNDRHGHGISFENQPWKLITDNVGTGFVIGQAIKKLMELKSFVPKDTSEQEIQRAYLAWRREALGAIVYITMAVMYTDFLSENNSVNI